MTYKTFETERLILQPTSVEDAEFIFRLLNTPKWKQYIGDRNIKSVEAAKQYIEDKMRPQLKELGYSNYTVKLKDTGTKIGTSGLYNREGLDGVDIGFAFLPEFEGKGYAFEATSAIKDAAFNCFNLKALNAITLPENKSSQKLLGKLGFTFQNMVRIPNDDEDLMLFTLKHQK